MAPNPKTGQTLGAFTSLINSAKEDLTPDDYHVKWEALRNAVRKATGGQP